MNDRRAERWDNEHAGRPNYAWAVAGITAFAAVIRVMFLWRPPLWRDEAFTAEVVSRPSVGSMLDAVRHDSAPPLSYLLLHVVAMVNSSAASLRLVSVAAGTCAVPIAAALGRRCGGMRAGLFAAAALAVAPAFVTSARDARMYALATTLVMLCVLTLWRAIDAPTWGRVITHGLAVALAMYTQYFAVFAIAAALLAGIVLLGASRATAVRVTGATAAGGATLAPWLVAAAPQFQHAATPFWVLPVGITSAVGVISQFFAGTPVDPGTPDKFALQIMQGLAIAGGVAGWLALMVAIRRGTAHGRPAALLAASGLGAIAILVAVSLWHPLLEARYASVLWGPLAVLIGVGLAQLRPPIVAVAALAAMLLSSVSLSVGHLNPDAPDAAAYLNAHAGPHDYISATAEQYQLMQYYGNARTRDDLHITADSVAWYWGTAAYPPDAVVPRVPASVAHSGGTVYTVGTATDGPPALPAGYTEHDHQCWVGICVAAYRR